MVSLEEEIAYLEKEIKGYTKMRAEAEDKGNTARVDILLTVIASSRETLNRLYDKQRDQARGK